MLTPLKITHSVTYMARRSVQTGEPQGTYKRGDVHPAFPDRFFKSYDRYRDGRVREVWVTKENFLSMKKYREDNAHKWNATWYQKNKGAVNSKWMVRNRNLMSTYSTLPDAHKGIVKGIYEASQRVSKCLGVAFHVDHVVPISKGGQHTPENLQIVPAKWNLQKSNKNTARWV